jgi:chromosome partitioning protein
MILSLVGQKGGGGKSTAATSLAYEGTRRGLRVLLIDADPQKTVMTWGAVGAEGLDEPMPTIVAMGAGLHKPDQVPRMAKDYDLIVVDCPPRHSEIQRAALMVSDMAIIPCGPSPADAWALAETAELVREAQTVRPKLRAAILLTRVQGYTALGRGARDVVAEAGLPVLASELGFRVAFQEALAAGSAATDYAPGSPAADEVKALFDEVVGHGKAQNQRKKTSRKP